MKIYLEKSGGISGIILKGEIDTGTLADTLAANVERLVTEERLRAATVANPQANFADGQQFTGSVERSGRSLTFRLDEASDDSELCDLFDELLRVIVQRQRDAVNWRDRGLDE